MRDPQSRPGGGARLAGLGMELAATLAGACLLGYWIDRHFGVRPWGLIVCALIGIVGGLYNLLRQALRETSLPQANRHDDGDQTGP